MSLSSLAGLLLCDTMHISNRMRNQRHASCQHSEHFTSGSGSNALPPSFLHALSFFFQSTESTWLYEILLTQLFLMQVTKVARSL